MREKNELRSITFTDIGIILSLIFWLVLSYFLSTTVYKNSFLVFVIIFFTSESIVFFLSFLFTKIEKVNLLIKSNINDEEKFRLKYPFFHKISLGFFSLKFFFGCSLTVLASLFYTLENKLFFLVLCIAILSFIVILSEVVIGILIGKTLSKEAGLILGIVLIVLGITLFIGIPIIIYSNPKKENIIFKEHAKDTDTQDGST